MSYTTLNPTPRSRLAIAALSVATAIFAVCPSADASTPIPAPRPGFWAQAICSEGVESVETDGFVESSFGGYPIVSGDVDTCLALGGSLTLHDWAEFDSTAGSGPMWVYEAPAVSTIAGGFLKLTMKSPGGEAYVATPLNENNVQNAVANCNSLCTSTTSTTANITHSGGWLLFAVTRCVPPAGEATCTKGPDAEMNITSGVILLHNEAKPAASGVAGTLLANPASGTASLTFNATDENGPGVYRAVVQLDGAVVWQQTPNLNEGKCVARGTYDEALVFRSNTPCPQKTAVDAEIPTAGLANGTHQLTVNLEDAAGNSATVYSSTITIANHVTASTPPVSPPVVPPTPAARGAANGAPASEAATLTASWQGSTTSVLKTGFGPSNVITGRLLTSGGIAIQGAIVEVSSTSASLGAKAAAVPAAHTDSTGSFSLRLPPGMPSSSIVLSYRSHLGDAQPAATRTLTLNVEPKLHLRISQAVVRVGETVHFAGVLAGPIPPGGKQLTLLARGVEYRHVRSRKTGKLERVPVYGQWIEFHTMSTDANGAFHAKHRFKEPGPQNYQFEVVTPHESDFPFLAGHSNYVALFET